jgi:formiminotetrahydrofolate cyclodeaminase
MTETTPTLTRMSVREMTGHLASREPIPGGGSAAALAGAMGAALVSMVAELSLGRGASEEEEARIRELGHAGRSQQAALLDLSEEDSAAYAAVVAARRLPRESDEERAARTTALNAAMHAAADVPLRTAAAAAEVLELAERMAPIGNRNAVSDVGVAAVLAVAGVRGALLNVRINLPYLQPDDPLTASAPSETARLEEAAAERERATMEVVQQRIAPS